MGETAVTVRYAEALYELAHEAGATEDVLKDLAGLKVSLEGNPEAYSKLMHALVSTDEKMRIARESFLGDRHPLVRNTVLLLLKRGRYAALNSFFSTYLSVHEDREGIVRVIVEVATPLDSSVKDQIQERINSALGKPVVLETRTVPELLGGMRFRMGSQLVDGSLKSRLDRMERQLRAASLDVKN